MKTKYAYHKFTSLYFALFLGIGGFVTLVTLYLENIGFTGNQIGIVTSINALMTIIIPPLWAFISDFTHKHKLAFLTAIILSSIISFFIPLFTTFRGVLFIFTLFYIFVTPIISLLDGITLKTHLEYGKIRLWGSVGFALSAFFTSILADLYGINILFILLGIFYIIGFVICMSIQFDFAPPKDKNEYHIINLLKNKTFMIFLLYIFFVGGGISSNNYYFGLYFKQAGLSATYIGLAFMLFALSEVPFMIYVKQWIKRFGHEKVLIFSSLMGIIRWGLYSFNPPYQIILALFILQGLFYASFIVGGAEYIKEKVTHQNRSTAMALYSAVFFGVGGIFANYISGYIYDHFTANYIYVFYTVLTFIGFIIISYLYFTQKKRYKS